MRTGVRVITIQTVAGTGESGFSGDGGRGLAARLNEPKAVALDRQGDLFIADSENHAVRKVDRTTGTITTIVGKTGAVHSHADSASSPSEAVTESEDPFGVPRTLHDQAFAQRADLSGTVRYVAIGAELPKRFGGDDGPANEAQLNFPAAIVIDRAGHLYLADTLNHRVRRVDALTGRIATIAGMGRPRCGGDGGPAVAAWLNEPAALAVSASGVLYIADQSNHRVRAIDLASGLICTVAGTGAATYNGDGIPAAEAALAGPSGLALADDGTLYIADTFNGRIRAIDPATGLIRTVVGDGSTYRYQGADGLPSASLSRPSGIALDRESNLFITDSDNHVVRRWDSTTGMLDRVAGVGVAGYDGDDGPALEASLNYPFGVAVDGEGELFIADTFNHRIRRIVL
jgi:DNA-binding beta-propeller fold protein YncE